MSSNRPLLGSFLQALCLCSATMALPLLATPVPSRIYVSGYVEQDVFDQTAPGTECYPGAPCQYSGSSLLKIWSPSGGFEQYVSWPACVDAYGEPWCGGVTVITTWPETNWPPQGLSGAQTTYTYYTDCSSTTETNTVGPMFGIPWVRRDLLTTEWWEQWRCFWDDGTLFGPAVVSWYPTRRRTAQTTIKLYTGIEDTLGPTASPPAPSALALFRIRVQATDNTTGLPIPPTNITVRGLRCDASGDVFLLTNENLHVPITPVLPASFTDYAFDVTHEKALPQIWRTFPDGSRSNVTDRTQTVWVGEQIDLTCVSSGSWTNFTNCAWTVPGVRVAGWNPTPTQAMVVPFNATNSGVVRFYWISEHSHAEVRCVLALGGFTFTLKTYFDVRRPNATFRLFGSDIVLLTNDHCLFLLPLGTWCMTTGRACGSNEYGMIYSVTDWDLKGYSNSCEFLLVQTGLIDWRANEDIPNNVPSQSSWEIRMRGLDLNYPYAQWAYPFTNMLANDTPHSALTITHFRWRTDNFESFLLFRPAGGIPVPLKRATWDWRATVGRVGSNEFSLYTPTRGPQNSHGFSTHEHPQWTNKLQNWYWLRTEYPGQWFPTP